MRRIQLPSPVHLHLSRAPTSDYCSPAVGGRLLLSDPGAAKGGGGVVSPGRPTHPPTSEQIPSGKQEIYSRGRKFEVDFRDTNFPLASVNPASQV